MTRPRVFLAEPWSGGPLPLDPKDARHLLAVLRCEVGDEIVVVTPDGRSLVAHIDDAGPDRLSASVQTELPAAWIPQVLLVQAVAKNPRMDAVIEKATEVGVATIIPFAAERSVVRLEGAKALDRTHRWQRVATAAAKQSRRVTIPAVHVPRPLGEVAKELDGVDHVLVCDENGGELAPGIGTALKEAGAHSHESVAVVVGPEGGLTDEECKALVDRGATRVTLGPTILRTETAGAVATALAAYELGGLGGTRRE